MVLVCGGTRWNTSTGTSKYSTTEMARDTSGSMWYKLEQGGMTRVLSTIQNFDSIDSQSPEEIRREGAASQGRRDSDAAEFGRHSASVSEGTMSSRRKARCRREGATYTHVATLQHFDQTLSPDYQACL